MDFVITTHITSLHFRAFMTTLVASLRYVLGISLTRGLTSDWDPLVHKSLKTFDYRVANPILPISTGKCGNQITKGNYRVFRVFTTTVTKRNPNGDVIDVPKRIPGRYYCLTCGYELGGHEDDCKCSTCQGMLALCVVYNLLHECVCRSFVAQSAHTGYPKIVR